MAQAKKLGDGGWARYDMVDVAELQEKRRSIDKVWLPSCLAKKSQTICRN
ncbi:Hypothetical predicted protein [Olea europaea subsp. europaea]|uniref:Uncharacterized protein n=1 Tax=Olea europaea subsp. europaea TaxID=158383 RepID=A0A8S0URT1_OLEEU|nr:Hypothetical predicted protein [Olea europaea subsp. europaea]